jgi:sugar lactone lactonase YvrE
MNTKLTLTVTTALLVALISILISLFNRNFFAPPPIQGSHDTLHAAKVISVLTAGATGPESLAFDPTGGGPYVGVSDGRILKWQGDSLGWTDFAFTSPHRDGCSRPFAPELEHVCGRPLGLRFDKKTGDLYIADAYFGLQMVGPAGGLATQLVTEAEGQQLYFTNDMDIDEQEDVIYFTDTSKTFRRRQFMASLLSGDKTGRLLKYDKSSKEVKVLLRDLGFANGVALSKDRSFVLVAETLTCKILRLWLKGPNTGNVEVFAELPGFPDNVRTNSKGEFWVGLHSKKGTLAKLMIYKPWVGKTLLKLPFSLKQLHSMLVGGKPHAIAIKLSEEGNFLEVLEDCDGKSMKFISEAEEKDGKLWMGSVLMPFVGVYDLP